jgi:proline iminopeptidase
MTTKLYPPIEPFQSGHLKVSEVHNLYYEQSGNPDGKPIVFLHGGPGGGVNAEQRTLFDPQQYRIVLFDQRGAGKSTPHACLEDNTTWHLVDDIERLRTHLNIEKWVVFGGSWGSTLALAYAETHPDRVKALILRGIFMLRRKELIWFYQEGANFLFPEAFDKYLEPIPVVERGDVMSAYHRRLTGTDEAEKLKCAKAWTTWEMSTSRLYVDPSTVAKGEEDHFALAFSRIENHYFVNGGFFQEEDQLLKNAHKLANIPGVIVQGRYDVVCPAISAYDLHKAWPQSELFVIPDAGHSMKEPGILSKLVEYCDKFRDL